MNKISAVIFIVTFSLFLAIACNSTNSGDSEPLLKQVVQNSTWYVLEANNHFVIQVFQDPEFKGWYRKYSFSDSEVVITWYELPCGSGTIYQSPEIVSYEVPNSDELIVAGDSVEVISYSEDHITIPAKTNVDEEIITVENTMKLDCQELESWY